MASSLFRTKSIDLLLAEGAATGEGSLKRTLGPVALVALGIGAIIGAGLFVRTAAAIADRAGPSVTIAFLVAGLGCAFAGLCYAEFASMIPIAGSAYTYSYATMGEFVAWIIGWDLVLEYAVGASTVAIAWSEYLNKVIGYVGWQIPYQWCHSPFEVMAGTGVHGIMNIPAVGILFLLSALLIRGTQESAFVNAIIVVVKVTIVIMVISIGWGFINPANHTPYIPEATLYTTPEGITHAYGGIMGILGAAGVVFFAYIGFDAVSTAAQEAKNPKRDMPIGILGSLVICTILYILFAHVLSGVATVEDFRSTGREASVAFAISKYMVGYEWLSQSVTHRHPGRVLVGHPGHAAGPVARVLLDEPRRPGAEGVFGRPPEVSDALQVEHALLRVHGALWRIRSGRHRRRDDQHRHAVRVHARLRRRLDHARPAAGHSAWLHRASAAGSRRYWGSSSAAP